MMCLSDFVVVPQLDVDTVARKCVQSLHTPVKNGFTSRLAKQPADLPDTVPSACDGGKDCFAAFAQATRLWGVEPFGCKAVLICILFPVQACRTSQRAPERVDVARLSALSLC
jgi:hypothetical protein